MKLNWQLNSTLGKRKGDSMSEGSASYVGSYDGAIEFAEGKNETVVDIKSKRAALKMSPSVVSVCSSIGGKESFCGSGTIIDSIFAGGESIAAVLTSAYIVPSPENSNNTPEISVRLANGEAVSGSVRYFNRYYNIALIEIHSKVQLRVAELRPLDDSVDVSQDDGPSCYLDHEYRKIYPGDRLTIVGRAFQPPFQAVAFTVEYFTYPYNRCSCDELLILDRRMVKTCIGGPVINSDSEVIGLAHSVLDRTSFTPTNVVLRWLDANKNERTFRQLRLGLELGNLYSTRIGWLEKFAHLLPDVSKGIIVKSVHGRGMQACSSPKGDYTGLWAADAIVECDGEIVRSKLQFFDMICGKDEITVELKVMRVDTGSYRTVKFTPKIADENHKLDDWPF
ncbi:hypothetical protein LUZ61_018158 [Rhynchospora tenuis]|uniref:Uncharacterized protein n=1 Tax=Rhynchospora tenuis TaxID=198213 RepID=A0AAD5Z903_9POAL|nr:hypothetical protein LUZ61_018158 [Rhynchospora tenuis]